MRQVETSRTLVFDQDARARAFFEALLCENMDPGRPENVELPFRRGQRLTPDGLLFACFCTRVYDHVLRPLMAPGRPSAPPELAAALDTLDQLTARRIAEARVPTAA